MPFLPALLFVGGNLSGSYGIAKPPASVVRGLDPRIHVFAKPKQDVDARDKRGHDEISRSLLRR